VEEAYPGVIRRTFRYARQKPNISLKGQCQRRWKVQVVIDQSQPLYLFRRVMKPVQEIEACRSRIAFNVPPLGASGLT